MFNKNLDDYLINLNANKINKKYDLLNNIKNNNNNTIFKNVFTGEIDKNIVPTTKKYSDINNTKMICYGDKCFNTTNPNKNYIKQDFKPIDEAETLTRKKPQTTTINKTNTYSNTYSNYHSNYYSKYYNQYI